MIAVLVYVTSQLCVVLLQSRTVFYKSLGHQYECLSAFGFEFHPLLFKEMIDNSVLPIKTNILKICLL